MFGYTVAIFLAATILIPCLIGVARYRKLPVHHRFIVILLLIGLLTELALFTLPHFGINNLPSSHIYALLEIIMLSLFFIVLLKSSREKSMVKIVMMISICISVVYSFIGNNVAEFNSLPRALECVYFSALSCYLFYEISIASKPVDNSIFFMNGAILFYFSSCFIVFAFSKYQASDMEMLLVMHNMHSIISAICYTAYAVGLWTSKSSYSAA